MKGVIRMAVNPAARIRGICLIEKMKTDPAYAECLTLKNTSKFCGIRIAESDITEAQNMNRRETENEKNVQSIACTRLNDHSHSLQRR